MSTLVINLDQFPSAIDSDATTGSTVRLNVTGRIYKIEDDLVDITGLGDPPTYMTGQTTVTIAITGIERAR